MKEIKDVEEKIKNDPRRLDAYREYQKYEKMLGLYHNPASKKILLKNTFNPFMINKKSEEKKGINAQEFEAFCEKIDQMKQENSKVKLNDMATREGRKVISSVISQYNEEFKPADLDSVAVAKCQGLWEAVYESQNKENSEIVQILKDKEIPIPVFENARKNVEDYAKNNRREIYEKCTKEKSQDIVHITAAALEIGPGEAESSLSAFEVLEGQKQLSEFDRRIQVDYTYAEYQHEYDLIGQAKSRMDVILYDDRLTDHEKEAMINDEQKKIEGAKKRIEKVKNMRSEQQKVVRGMENRSKTEVIEIANDREVG